MKEMGNRSRQAPQGSRKVCFGGGGGGGILY
eukprot:COSAG06_NODE_67435_length_252_cov_0.575163_1_plen_30_part_10